jgi:hypothetical protein
METAAGNCLSSSYRLHAAAPIGATVSIGNCVLGQRRWRGRRAPCGGPPSSGRCCEPQGVRVWVWVWVVVAGAGSAQGRMRWFPTETVAREGLGGCGFRWKPSQAPAG